MNTDSATSLKSLFGGIKNILNTVRKQNPGQKDAIVDLVSMCDEALESQSFSKLSFKMREMSIDVDQDFDDYKSLLQNKYQGFVRDVVSSGISSYTPSQKNIIEKLTYLSKDKKACPAEVFTAMSDLSMDMAVSMSAYRKDSYGEKEIGNTEFSTGVDSIIAADVATAGKRISRDLTRLSKQLKSRGSTDSEVIKILNEIDEAQKGEVKFYESMDLLSRITWMLYRLNEKSVNREKEYLVSLSSQFSNISKSCMESLKLSEESEEELKSFDKDFMDEINKITSSANKAISLDELKVTLAQHVEKMQDKLSQHMLNQSVKIKKQKQVIESQTNEISHLSEKIESQQNEIHEISVESGIDQLTSLPNRRNYDAYFKESHQNFISDGTSLSLMLLDIDKFKQVNDNYGHSSGDSVLKDFANILAYVVEKIDGVYAARYGGEEFAIIGTGMSRRKFINLGKKIKQFMENKKFKVENEKVLKCTVSIGISFFSNKGDTIDNVFKSADKALYKAKDEGRNQLWISNRTMMVKSEEKEMFSD